MTQSDKAPRPNTPKDAVELATTHRNPFGEHPQGIGPTLGEDLDEDEEPPVSPKP